MIQSEHEEILTALSRYCERLVGLAAISKDGVNFSDPAWVRLVQAKTDLADAILRIKPEVAWNALFPAILASIEGGMMIGFALATERKWHLGQFDTFREEVAKFLNE